jgi:hypothetical protein
MTTFCGFFTFLSITNCHGRLYRHILHGGTRCDCFCMKITAIDLEEISCDMLVGDTSHRRCYFRFNACYLYLFSSQPSSWCRPHSMIQVKISLMSWSFLTMLVDISSYSWEVMLFRSLQQFLFQLA